jgi:putative aldouronate transport system substrate-binding protein
MFMEEQQDIMLTGGIMMKNRLNRSTALALALVLLVAIVAGCGQTAATPATPSPSAASEKKPAQSTVAAEAPEQETLSEETLVFYFLGDKRAATDEVWTAISEAYKDKLNAKFDINFVPFGDFKDKLMLMSSAGEKYDMNFDGDWLAYPAMVINNSYLPLNDLLPKYAPVLNDKYMKQGTLKAATVNGQVLALPWTMKMNQRQFLTWRSDLTQAAGVEPAQDAIRTIEEIETYLYKLKTALPEERLLMNALDPVFQQKHELAQLSVGADLFIDLNDPACKVIAAEEHPYYTELAGYAAKWYKDGIISRDALVNKEDGATLWRNGKFIVTLSSHEWANANQGFSDPSWTVSSSFLYPDKKYPNRTALANVVCISKNAANPERTLMFLDLLETDRELYDMVQYGIEGKTYVLKEGVASYPDGMDNASSNYMEWGGQWALWKPQFMRPNPSYSEGFWVREAEFAEQPNNINSPIDGLFINTDSIKNELVRRNQIMEEYGKPIRFGVAKDTSAAITEYRQKMQEADRDKILAEVQKQIDAYLAANK